MAQNIQKVVIAGSIDRKFSKAITKLASVHRSLAGNGDDVVCIVAGDFLNDHQTAMQPFMTGEKRFPIHIYYLGTVSAKQEDFIKKSRVFDDQLCPNLSRLGKMGVFRTVHGLTIAYLAGVEGSESNPWTFTQDDVNHLIEDCAKVARVHVLITYQWPYDENNEVLPPSQLPRSQLISELVVAIKPRHHFAANLNTAFTSPLMGHTAENTSPLTTQFIGLAPFSLHKVQKWIVGMSMRINEPPAPPQIPLPFKVAAPAPAALDTVRFDVSPLKRRDNQATSSGLAKQRKTEKVPPQKCWFCLGANGGDPSLVLAMGKNAYLSLAKGQIVDGHILVVSIQHVSDIREHSVIDEEFKRFMESLKKYFMETLGKMMVYFERNFRSPHAFWECVPIEPRVIQQRSLENQIEATATERGLEVSKINIHTVPNLRKKSFPQEYFYLQIADYSGYLFKVQEGQNFPISFAREAICCVLNLEDRIRWQDCAETSEVVKKNVAAFREGYKPYNFTA